MKGNKVEKVRKLKRSCKRTFIFTSHIFREGDVKREGAMK
jgi:hypothetical protein